MDKEKLKKQLSDGLLGISKMCVAGALAVAGGMATSQAASVGAMVIGDIAGPAVVAPGSLAISDDAAILLEMANPEVGDQFAGHVSHASHASHASHSSHISHYSS